MCFRSHGPYPFLLFFAGGWRRLVLDGTANTEQQRKTFSTIRVFILLTSGAHQKNQPRNFTRIFRVGYHTNGRQNRQKAWSKESSFFLHCWCAVTFFMKQVRLSGINNQMSVCLVRMRISTTDSCIALALYPIYACTIEAGLVSCAFVCVYTVQG